MNMRMLRQLIRHLESSTVHELEIRDGDGMVRIRRSQLLAAPTTAPESAPAEPADSAADAVLSPLVGRFYRAASPEALPLVTEGAVVDAGDAVGVVAAMNTISRIETPRGGVVREILVTDGTAVEFGQPLLLIA